MGFKPWLGVACALCFASVASAAPLADLGTDFSTTSNPTTGAFGTWSYNAGTVPLPQYVASWAGEGNLAGWTTSANTGGDFLPFFTQVTSANVSSVWNNQAAVGDVIIHDWDSSNGDGNGQANVTWTSPSAMTATISGQAWWPETTGTGREQEYELILNPGASQSVLVPPTPIVETVNTFANPLTFNFPNTSLNSGDVLELLVQEAPGSPFGYFTGVRLSVTTVPEPGSLAVAGIGAMACLVRRRGAR